MIVVYLYGKDVFAQVSIQYVLKSFLQLDEAIRLISERIGLSFEKSMDLIGYREYNCIDYTKDVRIIAESIQTL